MGIRLYLPELTPHSSGIILAQLGAIYYLDKSEPLWAIRAVGPHSDYQRAVAAEGAPIEEVNSLTEAAYHKLMGILEESLVKYGWLIGKVNKDNIITMTRAVRVKHHMDLTHGRNIAEACMGVPVYGAVEVPDELFRGKLLVEGDGPTCFVWCERHAWYLPKSLLEGRNLRVEWDNPLTLEDFPKGSVMLYSNGYCYSHSAGTTAQYSVRVEPEQEPVLEQWWFSQFSPDPPGGLIAVCDFKAAADMYRVYRMGVRDATEQWKAKIQGLLDG